MYRTLSVPDVRLRPLARGLTVGAGGLGLLALTAGASAGPTNLTETSPVVWVMVAISVAGAIITWGVMVYALWKFRDPATRKRRYG
jgi:heme/copper-type cytochrome/quinol oxidase subunit 2